MIPAIILGAGLFAVSSRVIGGAAVAGASYGYGRKMGRKICQTFDRVEENIVNIRKIFEIITRS